MNLNPRRALPPLIACSVLAMLLTGCAESEDGNADPAASDSTTTEVVTEKAASEPTEGRTENAADAGDVPWQDLCIFTPAQIDSALKFSGINVGNPFEPEGYYTPICEYRDEAQEFQISPYSVTIEAKAYGPDLGYAGSDESFSFDGETRADAYDSACQGAKSIGDSRCGMGTVGDYVVSSTFVWIFRDDVLLEVFANGGDVADPDLVAGLERLGQSAISS